MIWLVMWSGLKELKRNTNTTHWNKNDWNHSRRKCYEIMENFKANWIWENCYKSRFYLSSSNLITSHSRDGSTPSDSATAGAACSIKCSMKISCTQILIICVLHFMLPMKILPHVKKSVAHPPRPAHHYRYFVYNACEYYWSWLLLKSYYYWARLLHFLTKSSCDHYCFALLCSNACYIGTIILCFNIIIVGFC